MSFNYKTVVGVSAYKPWKNWSQGDFLVGNTYLKLKILSVTLTTK